MTELATEGSGTRQGIPRLHDDAPKRVTTSTPPSSRPEGLGFSPGALARRRYPQQRPQEGNHARRHGRHWHRSAELSPENTFARRPVS